MILAFLPNLCVPNPAKLAEVSRRFPGKRHQIVSLLLFSPNLLRAFGIRQRRVWCRGCGIHVHDG